MGLLVYLPEPPFPFFVECGDGNAILNVPEQMQKPGPVPTKRLAADMTDLVHDVRSS
jgi:hypothetical protein